MLKPLLFLLLFQSCPQAGRRLMIQCTECIMLSKWLIIITHNTLLFPHHLQSPDFHIWHDPKTSNRQPSFFWLCLFNFGCAHPLLLLPFSKTCPPPFEGPLGLLCINMNTFICYEVVSKEYLWGRKHFSFCLWRCFVWFLVHKLRMPDDFWPGSQLDDEHMTVFFGKCGDGAFFSCICVYQAFPDV